MWEISYCEDVPWKDIDIVVYKDRKSKWIWCFEALIPILIENNIKTKYYGDIK